MHLFEEFEEDDESGAKDESIRTEETVETSENAAGDEEVPETKVPEVSEPEASEPETPESEAVTETAESAPETAEAAPETAEQITEEEIADLEVPAATEGETKKKGFISRHKVLAALLIVFLLFDLVVGAGYGYFHSKYELMDYTEGDFVNEAEDLSEEEIEEDQKSADDFAKTNEDVEEAEVVEATGDIFSDSDVYNILLIGSDDRTKKFNTNARGDTCILLSVNKRTNQVHLVSFERAIGMPILAGTYKGQYDWLTHTFRYGGPHLMTREIRECFKVDVTKYIRVNIWTFIQLVNSVGGVDIDMTAAEADNINHPEGTYTAGYIKGMHVENEVQQDLVEGVNHLNGATAMCYARLRSIDSDWNRVQRQRRVILAAVEEMKKLSIPELNALLNNVLPMVQTNLTESDITELIGLVPEYLGAEYSDMTIPFDKTYGMMTGMDGRRMFAVDFDTNAQILQGVLYYGEDPEKLEEYYSSLDRSTYYSSESYLNSHGSTSSGSSQSSGSSSYSAGSSSAAQTQTQTQTTSNLLTDPNTGLLYDPNTGIVYDPTTGAVVGTTPDSAATQTTDPNAAAAATAGAAQTTDPNAAAAAAGTAQTADPNAAAAAAGAAQTADPNAAQAAGQTTVPNTPVQ